MITLVCGHCGHENEVQRIYCHECGIKLDRSSIPSEEPHPKEIKKQQQRLKKMTNPYNGFFVGWPRKLVNNFLLAIVTAGLIPAVRTPLNAPPGKKRGELVDAPQIILILEDATSRHTLQRFAISEADANAYLGNTVKSVKIELPWSDDALKFDRAFVNMEEGICRIVQQYSFYDLPFYLTSSYRLQIKEGKLEATNVGGALGRVPIHPLLMQTPELIFQGVWDNLKHEKRLLDKMQTVEVHKGNVLVVTKADAVLGR